MSESPIEILLIDDSLSDVTLALHAFRKFHIANHVQVMLTSSREERDIAECYQLGGNSYIVKPVDFAQFTSASALSDPRSLMPPPRS